MTCCGRAQLAPGGGRRQHAAAAARFSLAALQRFACSAPPADGLAPEECAAEGDLSAAWAAVAPLCLPSGTAWVSCPPELLSLRCSSCFMCIMRDPCHHGTPVCAVVSTRELSQARGCPVELDAYVTLRTRRVFDLCMTHELQLGERHLCACCRDAGKARTGCLQSAIGGRGVLCLCAMLCLPHPFWH